MFAEGPAKLYLLVQKNVYFFKQKFQHFKCIVIKELIHLFNLYAISLYSIKMWLIKISKRVKLLKETSQGVNDE